MAHSIKQGHEFVHIENHKHDYFVEPFKKKTNWTMPHLHMHNSYELYFLISGDVRYSIGHHLYDVNSGDIVIIPKNTTHRTFHRTEKALERVLIYFSDNFISAFKEYLGSEAFEAFFKLGCVRLEKPQQDRVCRIFIKMLEAQAYPDAYSRAEIFTLLCELIVLIMRHGCAVERVVLDTTESRIMEAAEYIKKNFSQELTLNSVAQIVCMESTYFSKCFKKLTGFKFHDYLIQTRLQKSEEYLINAPLSIGKIAEECGFTSANHFGDVFKKYKGISPREFKAQGKRNKKE